MAPFDAVGFQVETKPQVVTEPWRKVLLDAADYIEAHGWARGRRLCGEAVCAHGALQMVISGQPHGPDGPLHTEAATHLHAYLTRLYPGRDVGHTYSGYAGIAPWNNEIARTAAEVCNALRECARAS